MRGWKAREPISMYILGQGPNPRTLNNLRMGKTLLEGSVLVSEEMKSDQSHLRSGPRKNPSSARQDQGQRVWSAIKNDISNHSMEEDKY